VAVRPSWVNVEEARNRIVVDTWPREFDGNGKERAEYHLAIEIHLDVIKV